MPNVEVLVHRAADFSFPSDHAVVAAGVAAGLVMVNRRVGVAASLLAGLLCFARVYVGVHYPGDLLSGAMLGAAVVILGWPLARLVLVPAVRAVAKRRLGWVLVGSCLPSRLF